MRLVVVMDEEKDVTIVLLTNRLTFVATTITTIYKDRWEFGNFFKELKQTLK